MHSLLSAMRPVYLRVRVEILAYLLGLRLRLVILVRSDIASKQADLNAERKVVLTVRLR
jgi:hypothetical protein